MNMKLVSAVTVLAAFASVPGLAQPQQPQPNVPKASKADVQKVISAIKADKAKMSAYCDSVKLDDQVNAIASKNQNDPKLQGLYGQLEAANKKVGADFEKIINSELDDASGALLEDLAKTCG
jgi:hypothetical protein